MAVEDQVAAPTSNGELPKTKPPAAAVRVTRKSTLPPCSPPAADAKARCPLVTFDLPYITFYYNQKLLVYAEEAGMEFGEALERLKAGLAAALVEFYPLTGRMAKDEDGVLVLEYGEGEGVEVVEAVAESVSVADLSGADAPAVLQDVVPYSGVMNLEGLHRPLLAVQFTKLKDGLAVGCAFNHAVLDGNSTWHFMGAWAELCRGGSAVSLPAFHDRTKARATRVKLDLPESAAAHEKADPSGPPKPLRDRIFSFSEAIIDRIKSEANADVPEGETPLSTFQSLGAHIWRAVCRARGLKPEEVTIFAIFADCRRRLDPPLPEGYFGNAIQAVFTGTASGLLLAHPPQFGAGLLRQAIQAHDAAAIDKRSSEWEAAPKLFYYRDAGINCVAVGSSPRFRIYDVDFGFGRPERVRSGANNKFDGMVYLYLAKDGGRGIDVELTIDEESLEKLSLDEEFLPHLVGA